MTRNGHRFVERGYFEGNVVGYDLQCLSADCVLDEEIVSEGAQRATVADDAAGRGHRIYNDMVADCDGLDG